MITQRFPSRIYLHALPVLALAESPWKLAAGKPNGTRQVWPMLSNWVANVRKAGLAGSMLVGALDPALAEICQKEGVPVEALDGQKAGMTNGQYLTKSQDDLRKYKLMASLKIGFALDLLKRQVRFRSVDPSLLKSTFNVCARCHCYSGAACVCEHAQRGI